MAHKKKDKRRLFVLIVLAILLAAGCLIFTGLGVIKIPPWEIARIIFSFLTADGTALAGLEDIHRAVILDIRLPRVLTAVLVGAGLATAGAVFQGLLMNPLADPYTLGVSTGAAFGATLAIFIGVFLPGDLGMLTVPLFAFAGALLALGAVYGLALVNGTLAVTNL